MQEITNVMNSAGEDHTEKEEMTILRDQGRGRHTAILAPPASRTFSGRRCNTQQVVKMYYIDKDIIYGTKHRGRPPDEEHEAPDPPPPSI